jgi:Fe-S oxidoreductase
VGSTALQFTKPDIAEKLTRARLEDARRSGAHLLITEDPGTLKQLTQYAEEFHLRITGLYELLAEHVIKDEDGV